MFFLAVAQGSQIWLSIVPIKSHHFDFTFISSRRGLFEVLILARPSTLGQVTERLCGQNYFIQSSIINSFRQSPVFTPPCEKDQYKSKC